MRVLDLDSQYWSGQIQNIESLKRLYSVCWVEISGLEGHWGWTTVWRLAATWWFFCWRGSWKAWPSALGGDGVDGHHYWWPCGLSRRIWVIFLQKRRKILGSTNSLLSVSNFRGRVTAKCFWEISSVDFQAKFPRVYLCSCSLPSLKQGIIQNNNFRLFPATL